jgi:hypothetical protein
MKTLKQSNGKVIRMYSFETEQEMKQWGNVNILPNPVKVFFSGQKSELKKKPFPEWKEILLKRDHGSYALYNEHNGSTEFVSHAVESLLEGEKEYIIIVEEKI